MLTRTHRRYIFSLAAIISLSFLTSLDAAVNTGRSKSLRYTKQASWAQTMLAARRIYQNSSKVVHVTPGPWYSTGPLKARNFNQALFPEKGIDLSARDGKGPLWTKMPQLVDGQVHNLPGGSSCSTYLFRIIQARRGGKFHAGIGSDDGVEMWLNGKKILSRNVARVAAAEQDTVQLKLKAGQNLLLMKIYNRSGGHGFYFKLHISGAEPVWKKLARDFPYECSLFKEDLAGAYLNWFERQDAILEKKLLKKIALETGSITDEIQKQLEELTNEKVSGNDPRWLELYLKGCKERQLAESFKNCNLQALRRAIVDLKKTFPKQYPQGDEYLARLKKITRSLHALASPGTVKQEIINEALALRQEALLSNPLLNFEKILVIRRNSKGPRLGLPQNWQGNCSLPRSGYDDEIAFLDFKIDGKLTTLYKPEKPLFVGDVDLEFDADKLLFSMIGSYNRWQIWEIHIDGTGLRQVTQGKYPDVDNYDACYLPDGRIIFDSTRCFQGIPCVSGHDTVANLFIMDNQGEHIRQLCFDQDHDWYPTVTNQGRILYTRWEYSDTPHYFSRLLFQMNPDGTNQMAYYGSNSFWPNSMFYSRPIPNDPTKVVTIVSGHHGAARMGELVILDPAKSRFEADGVIQRIPGYGRKVEPVIADQLVRNSWPKFLHPYPLSDKYFLVSCKPTAQSLWGIYLVDVFDNMLLIKELPGNALLEPIPLRKRKRPPIIPDRIDPNSKEGTVYLADIYRGPGLAGVPRGTVKKLRLYEFHYAYPMMGGHKDIGVEGSWDVHRILGTVPVNKDGSAIFKVPANIPIALQPLDKNGEALQIMRSWFVTMPGESLSCVGCHEQQNSTPPPKATAATYEAPAEIKPWYGPARGFSFRREVQPVLDKYCVGCHNTKNKQKKGTHFPDLTDKKRNGWHNFTPAYLELHPYVRRPGPESDYHLNEPLEYHASTSELIQMLRKGHHGVQLDNEAWDRLITWIDLNVPDHGTWSEYKQIAGNYQERREEMRTLYANCSEDPEAIPVKQPEKVRFVKPRPQPRPQFKMASAPGWPFDTAEARRRQQTAGKDIFRTIKLDDDVSLKLAIIPSGEFIMGGTRGNLDEIPPTIVKVQEPFWMGVTEVTVKQYRLFDPGHNNGYIDQHHKDHTTPGYPIFADDYPVVRISWEEAMAYCKWLTKKTGMKFTLPTEGQWEWACRAGTNTPFYYGDMDSDFSRYANLADKSIRLLAVSGVNPKPISNPSPYEDFLPKDTRFDDGQKIVCQVGQYLANPWGLEDMHGNVWEWTLSNYVPYPYDETDGRNNLSLAQNKVVRGGSWRDRPQRARAGFRLDYRPYQKVFNVGFRVICQVDGLPLVANANGE